MITIAPHPLLDLQAFVTTFSQPLAELSTPTAIAGLLSGDASAPFQSDDLIRATVRDLLRHGGYKPTGRGKPASEYLVKAAGNGPLNSINVAVDACNVVSMHSGLPISVVDLDRVQPPLSVVVAPPASGYVFNPAGQTIEVGGLPCLADSEGPCANAVKDSQRTKTHDQTTRTLTLIWGTVELPGRAVAVAEWYRELLAGTGFARVESC